jgi:predicted nucleic acid-binding Zn finger protein
MAVKHRQETVGELEARVARAAREGFVFTPLGDLAWACETEAGNCYLVRETGECGCPDFEYRAGPAGIACKHVIALRAYLLASGEVFAREAALRERAIEELRQRRQRKAKLLRGMRSAGLR